MSEWIKCSDRLPELGQEVLFLDGGREIGIGYLLKYTAGYHWEVAWSDDIFLSLEEVTHWMPVPSLPE